MPGRCGLCQLNVDFQTISSSIFPATSSGLYLVRSAANWFSICCTLSVRIPRTPMLLFVPEPCPGNPSRAAPGPKKRHSQQRLFLPCRFSLLPWNSARLLSDMAELSLCSFVSFRYRSVVANTDLFPAGPKSSLFGVHLFQNLTAHRSIMSRIFLPPGNCHLLHAGIPH